jgi:hypothetical protein
MVDHERIEQGDGASRDAEGDGGKGERADRSGGEPADQDSRADEDGVGHDEWKRV